MVAGHLREKNGYWHMVITYRDEMGNRKERSFTTHLKAKGNRRRAEEMLFEKRRQITADLDMRRNANLMDHFGNTHLDIQIVIYTIFLFPLQRRLHHVVLSDALH